MLKVRGYLSSEVKESLLAAKIGSIKLSAIGNRMHGVGTAFHFITY